jgi:RND superfamily putative drug exporter
VLAVWLAAFLVCAGSSGRLAKARHDDVLSYLPRDAQSTQAYQLAKLWGDADVVPAVVVYERAGGLTVPDRRKIAADAAMWAGVVAARDTPVGGPDAHNGAKQPATPGRNEKAAGQKVTAGAGSTDAHNGTLAHPATTPPGVPTDLAGVQFSPDNASAQFAVAFDGDDPKLADRVKHLRALLQPVTPALAGLAVHVGGPAGQSADSYGIFDTLDGPLLDLALGVVMVLLLLTYRSPVLWIVPLVAAFAGLTLAQEAAYLLAEHAGLTVNGLSQSIMLVLTVGAGVDYALLLVSRYREELTRYRDKHDAMAVALRNAGPAIVASAGTVAVSLLCLLFAVLNSDRGLGPVAALGVLGAFAAMVSLLPALLVALPRHTFWPQVPHFSVTPATRDTMWGRVARAVASRPRVTWIAASILLAGMAAGVLGLKSSGLSTADSFPAKPDSVRAQDAVMLHFPQDPGSVAAVIGDAPQAPAIAKALAADPGVLPDVGAPRVLGPHARFDVALVDTPDSPAAQETVRRLRAALAAVPGANARVGGLAAINLDIADASRYDREVVIPAVLIVVLLVLCLLLRSFLAPVMLIATVVLSFGAALGASWLVFRYCFGFHGTDVSYPLFSFVFLVALGIDYNIFLMTRIQEESRRLGTRAGTIRGVTVTGGVITSAGVVLAATFGVLATLPLVTLIEIGFTVAFGVLLDTLLVRSMLVPALAVDVGDGIWWPSRAMAMASGPDAPDPGVSPATPAAPAPTRTRARRAARGPAPRA